MIRAKISDVAKLANVAPSTVSNALNGTKFVSEEIKQKVREACLKLNYMPNMLASSMRTQRTNLIGLFLASSRGGFADFYCSVIEGVTLRAAEKDYNIIIYYDIENRTKLKSLLLNGRGPIDGAIMLTPSRKDFRIEELTDSNIQMVLIGKPYDVSDEISFVDVKNDRVAYDAAVHLLKSGYRRILFFNSDEKLSITKDRLCGYHRALEEHGTAFDEKYVYNVKSDEQKAEKLLEELMKNGLDFDAVITESDFSAKGVYSALAKAGRAVGKDVGVIALGGHTYADRLTPKLSTFFVDYAKLGELAVDMLVDKLNKKTAENYFISAEICKSESF